jgi:thiamine biosynthesis lipoprotein
MHPAASTSSRLAAALLGLLLAACRAPAPALAEEFEAFEGRIRVEIHDVDAVRAGAAFAELAETLRADDAGWHAWNASPLTRINSAIAAGESVQATPALLDLIERARPLVAASGGLVDPAIGGLIEAWGFHTTSFPVVSPPPSRRRIEAWLAQRPRLEQLLVDGDRVRSDNRLLQLDFGAMAEGAAALHALAILRRHGIQRARIDFGGGDAAVLGAGPQGPWRVALRDPFGGSLGEARLESGEALFSTGNFSKFRASATGARWPHILDPRTGHPARGTAAVVVIDSDAVRADAAATALYVAGPAGFEATARAMRIGCALLLTDENEILLTSAIASRLDLHRDPVPLGPPIDLGPSCSAGLR